MGMSMCVCIHEFVSVWMYVSWAANLAILSHGVSEVPLIQIIFPELLKWFCTDSACLYMCVCVCVCVCVCLGLVFLFLSRGFCEYVSGSVW